MIESEVRISGAAPVDRSVIQRAISYYKDLESSLNADQTRAQVGLLAWAEGYTAALRDLREERLVLAELKLRVRQLIKAADNSTCSSDPIESVKDVLDRLELLR